MKEIIIVGAGGTGREVLQWIKDINAIKKRWIIIGFIDDNASALDGYECSHSILGSLKNWKPGSKEVFVCAISKPRIKEKVVNELKKRGAIFTGIIHPTAIITEHILIGEGLIIYPYARISVNSKIGNFVTILTSIIGHDAEIGDFTTITSHCGINGRVKVGKRVFIGSHTTIIPDKNIGDNAVIGTGSVVIRNVEYGAKVAGNPARRIDI